MEDKGFIKHESAIIDDHVTIGKDTIIRQFCHVQSGTVIGEACSLGQNVNISNNVMIGSHVKIQNNVSVCEGVTLEDYVFCGSGCVFTNDLTRRAKYPKNHKHKPILICHDATIGANATIVCGHEVGAYATIADGAVVTSDVPPHALFAGVPAKQTSWVCECGEVLKSTVSCFFSCSECRKQYVVIDDALKQLSPNNIPNNLIIVHDNEAWIPKKDCNPVGYSLEEARETMAICGWKDARIYSVEGEIKKYKLKGNECHKQLFSLNEYNFDTWSQAYKDRNINVAGLPIEVESNQDYENDLRAKLDEFLDALDKPAFAYDKDLITSVQNNCESIKTIFMQLKDENRCAAERLLGDFLKPFIDEGFLVSNLDESYAFRGLAPYQCLRVPGFDSTYRKSLTTSLTFFRVRTKSINDNLTTISKLEDIVHLPYKLASKACDMRYSRKGNPCLYLAVTSWICAKECRWNEDTQELYGSAFMPTEDGKRLKVLNLAISQYLIDGIGWRGTEKEKGNCIDLQRAMLKLYPLVLAMSYRIKNTSLEKKYEYLISQCLMDVIQRVGIDGIAYLSAQGDDEFQYPHGVNLAIPAFDIDENNQFSKYCSKFHITKPVKFDKQDERTERSFINKIYDDRNCFSCKIKLDNVDVFYGDTEFSRFDNYLCSQKRETL